MLGTSTTSKVTKARIATIQVRVRRGERERLGSAGGCSFVRGKGPTGGAVGVWGSADPERWGTKCTVSVAADKGDCLNFAPSGFWGRTGGRSNLSAANRCERSSRGCLAATSTAAFWRGATALQKAIANATALA